MTFKDIQNNDTLNYFNWCQSGCREASDELNDGNREIIRQYMELFPNAMGYKFYRGLIDLKQEKHYNFFCDWVFNGTEESLIKVKHMEREFEKTHEPTVLSDVLEQADGICLIWS